MDPVAPDRLGDPDGARDRPAGGRHPRTPAASRTGLPRLSRPDAPGRAHGGDRLEAACQRAEQLRSYSFRTVEHILKHQQDRLPLDQPPARPAPTHENLRGATYYKEVYADPTHD